MKRILSIGAIVLALASISLADTKTDGLRSRNQLLQISYVCLEGAFVGYRCRQKLSGALED
jgi:hypothetical protein